jgi:hypothetical protein
MDTPPGNIAVNVTVDDFDAWVTYSATNEFTTPDPSNNASSAAAALFWERTFHSTTKVGASFTVNFTGASFSTRYTTH